MMPEIIKGTAMRKTYLLPAILLVSVSACGMLPDGKMPSQEYQYQADTLAEIYEREDVAITYLDKPGKLKASTYLAAEGSWALEYGGSRSHEIISKATTRAGLETIESTVETNAGSASARPLTTDLTDGLYGGPVRLDISYETLPDALSVDVKVYANRHMSKEMSGHFAAKMHDSVLEEIEVEKALSRPAKSSFFKLPW